MASITSTIADVAAEIQALINSKPQSPTKAELEAILRKAWVWREWAELVADYDAACVRSLGVEASSAGDEAIDNALLEEEAAHERLVDYATQIIRGATENHGMLVAAAFCLVKHGFIVEPE
jgi:hypothetical protein